jgi:hypothetical protein
MWAGGRKEIVNLYSSDACVAARRILNRRHRHSADRKLACLPNCVEHGLMSAFRNTHGLGSKIGKTKFCEARASGISATARVAHKVKRNLRIKPPFCAKANVRLST